MKDEKTGKVIAEARKIFLRYGFRRATMGEIADAANMSRPALYLVFPSKEEILTAVLTEVCREMLDEIRSGIDNFETEKEKLVFAFEIWGVRPFEIMRESPDARDLLESGYEFASRVTADAFATFENIIAKILTPVTDSMQSPINYTSSQVARILTAAVKGFKETAADTSELRRLIDDLMTMILASFRNQTSATIKNSKAKAR